MSKQRISNPSRPNQEFKASNSQGKGRQQGRQKPKGKSRAAGQKPPYSGKSFGSGSKQDRREEEVADTGAAMSRSNPVELYTKYAEFAHDAATIPFALPVGANYQVELSQGSVFEHTTPGLMRINFAPTIGVSSGYQSPMNRSSINFYARIRSKQKAFGDYDHQDVTMMMLALDSACMFHALGRRLYGVMRDMSPTNRYYPRAIISAHGVQFPNSQKEIQDFRSWLNSFALRIEQYALPDDINLIKRHQWMCEGIYVDSTSKKAQTYMFVPSGFWQYDNTVTTGSQLVWKQFIQPNSTPTQLTIEEFENFGDSLMNAMNNDADFALIAGDLYAYYENANLMKLPYITEDYSILPTYDEVVLSQIENASIMGDWAPNYTPLISQNPGVNQGAILFNPIMKRTTAQTVTSLNVNMHIDSPSPDQVIEATRLMVAATNAGEATTAELKITQCASEIVQHVDIFSVNPATQAFRSYRIDTSSIYFDEGESEVVMTNQLIYPLLLSKFDWCPRIHYWHNVASGAIEYLGDTWDTDNMNQLREGYLATIHEASLYSLFNVAT